MRSIDRLCGRQVNESEDWTFKTDVNELDIRIEDLHLYRGNASITWSLNFEARTWGIKELSPSILDFKVDYVEEFYDEPNDRDVQVNRSILMNELEGFNIEAEFEVNDENDRPSIQIRPHAIEIDDQRKKVTVKFWI